MNFQDTYKRDAFLDFFRDSLLPEEFYITDESIPLSFHTDRIKEVVKIGEVPSLDLPIFEITPQTIYLDIAAAMIVGVVAAVVPAWRAVTVPIAEGLGRIG